MRVRHACVGLVCSLALLGTAARARADGLVIETAEGSSWADAIAALESNVGAEGTVLHVIVHEPGGAMLPCGQYALTLDDVGDAAFAVGQCDPASNATPLKLANRSQLFSHDDVVPRARLVGIAAVEVLSGAARGGAGPQSGTTMHCTIEVHPYLVDQEHGIHVALFAPRFALRVLDANVSATPLADGWSLGADSRGQLTIGYDVVDTQSGQVVVTDHAQLTCGQVQFTPPMTAPAILLHPDVRDPAVAAVAQTSTDSETMAMWMGLSMHVYSSNALGMTTTYTGGAPLTSHIDPMAIGTLDLGMRFPIVDWLYVGAETGVAGMGGSLADGSEAYAVTFGALFGVHTTGGSVRVFAELLGEGALVWGTGTVRTPSGSAQTDISALLGVVDLRVGLECQLGDGTFAGARVGMDLLDPGTLEAGLVLGLRV